MNDEIKICLERKLVHLDRLATSGIDTIVSVRGRLSSVLPEDEIFLTRLSESLDEIALALESEEGGEDRMLLEQCKQVISRMIDLFNPLTLPEPIYPGGGIWPIEDTSAETRPN